MEKCEECSRAQSPGLQAKLRIGDSQDIYEREADRIAERVVSGEGRTATTSAAAPDGARKTVVPQLRRRVDGGSTVSHGGAAPHAVDHVLSSPGRALEANARAFMENRFGYDFGHVRIHTDARASASARAVDALAYTVGHHVVFDAGRFAPHSVTGRKLLAHELVHVVQQDGGGPIVQRWASCVEANISGMDCPDREAGETQRAKTGMVFFNELTDYESGRTGALIANFDIGKATVQGNLKTTVHWQQFLQLMSKNHTKYKLVGFSDCHESGNPSLRKGRVAAVLRAIPKTLQGQITSAEAAPDSACMRGNVTGADRALNRSVALVLEETTLDFAEDEENEVIVGKTPADRLRECQSGARVKTFPFRTTRFGGAPIMAKRDGNQIVVKMPMHVLTNGDFRKETNTLPTDTFLSGTRLDPTEIVRVRHYEVPHWYNLNITGDASGDKKTEYCVPAEELLDFASATNKAFWVNVAVTGVEGLTLGTPVGKWVGAGVSKLAAPAAKAGQTLTVAGMLSLRGAAPVLGGVSSRTATTLVEDVAAEQAVTRAVAPAATSAIADATVPAAVTSTVPRVGASVVGQALPSAAAVGGAEVGGGAIQDAFERDLDAAFSPAGDFDEGLYETTQRLIRGNAGERLAADALATDGHQILFFKPSILGTNQGGIDIVTLRNGVVNFVDNKALTRSGNVASVSALTTNFSRNMADMVADFTQRAANPALSQADRQVFQEALDAIAAGRYARIVTNANIVPNTSVLSGVTDNLARQGIGFINVMPTP